MEGNNFLKNDPMMGSFYEEYVVKGYVPTHEEIQRNVGFFATFSVGCLQQGMEELGKIMGDRLASYIAILKKIGWKSSKYMAGHKTFGLESILGGALWVHLGEER